MFVQRVKQDLEADPNSHKGFTIFYGNLLYKGRLFIVADSPWILELISTFHDSLIRGHFRVKKTHQRAASKVFWVGMREAIIDYVKRFIVCQQHKTITSATARLLKPITIPNQVWDEITMDFMEVPPKSGGYDTIWVVVDHFTQYGHFIP